MTQPIEAIFESKIKLNKYFPYSPDIKHFDLHRKQFLYGKIDRSGDAIMLEETNLKATRSGTKSTNQALTFVCDAFQDFQKYYRARVHSGDLDAGSRYSSDILVKRAYNQGDIEYNYHHYKNKLYDEFVNSYLKKDRRHEKVVDFKTFVVEFLKYFKNNAYNFPLTKTGYILSHHCSPFVSGLMLEIAPGSHGSQNSDDVVKFVTDPNFSFIRSESKKFGFMVDINAPWRLVFNVASGNKMSKAPNENGSNLGGKKYMANYGLNFENVFDFYFIKAHMRDLYNLKDSLLRFYTSYYVVNSTYERLEYVRNKPGEDCRTKKVTLAREGRTPPPSLASLDSAEYDEYFLKYLMMVRMLETNHEDIDNNFKMLCKELIESRRILGPIAALNYINNLTKGAPVSKFLRKGKYWYGVDSRTFDRRLKNSLNSIVENSTSDVEITGTKGKR